MKKLNKGFVIPLVISIIVLVMVGGGIYYTKTKQSDLSIKINSTIDQNVGWKTYTDSSYDIQFKYPDSWQIVDEKSDVLIVKIADSMALPKPDSDTPSNFFFVRTIGDADIRDLENGSLGTDGGWNVGFAGIFWRYVYNQDKNINIVMSALDSHAQKVEEQILSSFIYTDSKDISTTINNTKSVISSILPTFGAIGTVVKINGNNLSGFEGDKNIWIENSLGQKGIIYSDRTVATDKVIPFKLENKYCTEDISYSGKPCPAYLNIVQGVYGIYVSPWGEKSNEVEFTVTSN
ncbi:MAG: hypothetical protein HQ402_01390 [Parcubacteria group bacterium]|nr:hypothetical protein [Parcubacteria group bacterium]